MRAEAVRSHTQRVESGRARCDEEAGRNDAVEPHLDVAVGRFCWKQQTDHPAREVGLHTNARLTRLVLEFALP